MTATTVPELLQFEWERDLAGYEIVTREGVLLGGGTQTKWIRAKGGRKERYRPLEDASLFRRFAQLRRTESSVLAFARNHGLLGFGLEARSRSSSEEPISSWHSSIDVVRRMVVLLDHQEWPVLSDMFDKAELGRMTVRLPTWNRHGVNLVVEPNSLRSAIYLQLARSASSNERWRQCTRCSAWFAYGPGTGRRSTAEYCSDACRKSAFIERQSGGGSQ